MANAFKSPYRIFSLWPLAWGELDLCALGFVSRRFPGSGTNILWRNHFRAAACAAPCLHARGCNSRLGLFSSRDIHPGNGFFGKSFGDSNACCLTSAICALLEPRIGLVAGFGSCFFDARVGMAAE